MFAKYSPKCPSFLTFSLVRFNGDEEKASQVYKDTAPLQANDIADAIAYCANLPTHVCINDLTITCLNQANGIYVQKNADKL
jgi:NADP-dependent 3-hydroxy acid dehydrogenase YdfG